MSNLKKVVLIQGGKSEERSISLMTAKKVEQALKKMDIELTTLEADDKLYQNLIKIKPSAAFLAVHGTHGEDGILQGMLEYLKIPYTGSGVLSSALCMNKSIFKQLLLKHNVLTAPFLFLNKKTSIVQNFFELDAQALDKIKKEFLKTKTLRLPPFLPCVVKPNRSGSSIGITICHNEQDWKNALDEAFKFDHEVLIEEYIKGKEVAVAYLDGKILTPVEIKPAEGYFYDFKRKYEKNQTQYILPPSSKPEIVKRMKDTTSMVRKLCSIRTYGRLDFIVNDSGLAYALEINTLPGLTPLSLLPMSAEHDGISYEQVIKIILDHATLDYKVL